MSDIDNFIDREENKIANILHGLPIRKRIELGAKIQYIQYLLSLLRTASPSITKKEKKEIIKKIEKETKKLDDKKRDEQVETMAGFTAGRAVKPNITELDEDTIMKAKMVKASSIAYDTNLEQAQMFLDQNEIPYNIDQDLSDTETLILHNPETDDVKLASRGTKLTNAYDLLADGQTILGYENSNGEFQRALKQGQDAMAKYGKPNVSEGLGYSLGGAKQIYVTDALGIPKSTTFNPLIGKNVMASGVTPTEHNMFRTTEDIPSMMVGLKGQLDNFKINTILPKKISLDIREAHKLDNFTSNEKRVGKSQLKELTDEVTRTGNRLGEAEIIRDMANHIEGAVEVKPHARIPHADLNLKAKQMTHTGEDPFLDHRFKLGDPKNIREKNNPFYEPQDEESVWSGLLENEPDVDVGVDDLIHRHKPIKKEKKSKMKKPDEIKNKIDFSKDIQEAKDRIAEIDEELPIHETLQDAFTLDDVKGTAGEARYRASKIMLNNLRSEKEDLNRRLNELQEKSTGSQEFKERLNNNDLFENKGQNHSDILQQLRGEVKSNIKPEKTHFEKLFDFDKDTLKPYETENPFLEAEPVVGEVFKGSIGRPYTYSEYAHNYNSRRGVDTKVNEQGLPELEGARFSKGSKLHALWDEMGGTFTQKELNHFSDVGDTESTPWGIDDRERHFMREDTPAGRDAQIESYRQEHIDAVDAVDNYASLPEDTETGSRRSVTNDLIRGANPLSFFIGYYGGKGVDKVIDVIDPDKKLNNTARSALIGSSVGYGTESAMLALGGEGASILTASVALPALAAGATGAIAGGETYKYLRSKGVSDPVASAGSGAVGGGVAGATAAVVGGSIALATAEGATIGTAFDPVTMGTGTLIGAGLGALFGEGAYLMGKAGL
jgi:hypothetical protein